MEVINIDRFMIEVTDRVGKQGEEVGAVVKDYTGAEMFNALESFASQYQLIVYTKVAARKPRYRVDIRQSKQIISAKDNDFRICAVKAMMEGYRKFVILGRVQRPDIASTRPTSNVFEPPRMRF
jgi:hypothetical protein